MPNNQKFKLALSHDPAFFTLISHLAIGCPHTNPWSLVMLGWAEVQAIIQPCLTEGANLAASLTKWLNRSFLYQTKEDTYQILMPLHLESYLAFTSSAEAPDKMLKAVTLSLCFSWAHQPTPGHLLEQHICKRLATNFHLWGVSEDTPIAWVPKLNLNSSPTPMAMAGLFFSPKPNMGLDGVFILEDADMEGAYKIHTLQVKCSLLEGVITHSGAVDKQKHNNQRMVGILAKGLHGVSSLLPALTKHGIKNISQITFTLFTTKKVNKDAEMELQKGFRVREHKVEGFLHDQDVTLQLLDNELQHLVARKPSAAQP